MAGQELGFLRYGDRYSGRLRGWAVRRGVEGIAVLVALTALSWFAAVGVLYTLWKLWGVVV